MRILLANKHFLGLAGGAERNISDLANWLAAKGHEVTVFSETKHGTNPAFPLDPLVQVATPVTASFQGDDPAGDAEFDPDIRAWAKSNRSMRRKWGESIRYIDPDVILTFMPHTSTFLLYELGNEFPIIVTNQSDPEADYFSDKHGTDPVERSLRIELLRRAYAVHFLMPDFPGKMPGCVQRRSIVIPNAAPSASHVDLRREKKRIAAVGRLIPSKGFDVLIEAFAASRAFQEGWELHLFGSGPERERLLKLVRSLMAQRRIFLRGHTSQPVQELARAEIFVIPSAFEGWGLTLTEAMSVGVPSIGFEDCSGVNWLIQNEKNGLLIKRGVAELAGAIDRMAESPELRESLGSAGRESVKRFSPETVYGKWEQLIERAHRGEAP